MDGWPQEKATSYRERRDREDAGMVRVWEAAGRFLASSTFRSFRRVSENRRFPHVLLIEGWQCRLWRRDKPFRIPVDLMKIVEDPFPKLDLRSNLPVEEAQTSTRRRLIRTTTS